MITKSATDRANCTTDIHFMKSARSAFSHIIASCSKDGPKTVLLPAYIGFTEREGSGVFDPVHETGSGYCFYKVKDDLSVDLEDFRRAIEEGVDIALVIHYFGFCRSDMAEIKKICASRNVVLVEDCAHAFYLESKTPLLGRFGDFAFYSLHKYLPTETGGILSIVNSQRQILEIDEGDIANRDVLEQYAISNFDEIKDIRRRNYSLYEELLQDNNNLEVMYSLQEEEIPQTFSLRVKTSTREKLYFYLMDRGFPTTALYYRMIDQIDLSKHPQSAAISSEILNLPVHQDTNFDDIRNLCNSIVTFFEVEK